MAEIFGRATGCSKGRGGSMHLVAPEVGILGTSSIVSGSLSIAVGTALAESIRGTGRITAVFHGDGVPEEGSWHESVNLAAVRRLR
jgi:pyruvate dehydrogenase E1 component alpha subunit